MLVAQAYSDNGDCAADTRFLLATTATGATLVALEQYALGAALAVYLDDPFPRQAADWTQLLDGALGEFLRPRPVYYLSYFLGDEAKRWDARIASCRELARAAREFGAQRADGVDEIAAAATGERATALERHAGWRCLAGCDARDGGGPTPRALWREVSGAIADGRVHAPPLPRDQLAREDWLSATDAALDGATALARHPPLPPSWPDGEPLAGAVIESLARARRELDTRGSELLTARLAGEPSAALRVAPELLWRYGWAQRLFRGDGALVAAIETELRASGQTIPRAPRQEPGC